MYELYKISDDKYEIHSSFNDVQAMEGTFVAIFVYMTEYLKFFPDEVEYAMVEMIRKDHNAAHFGVNKMFIFSFNRSKKKVA
jgi:hypothetical protein